MRRYLLIVIAFVFATVVGIVWWDSSNSTLVLTLADGRRVEYLGTASGGNTFTTDKAWQKVARRLLPERWLPPAITLADPFALDTNHWQFFLKLSKSPDDSSGIPGIPPWHEFQVEDEKGFRFPKQSASHVFEHSSGKDSSQIYGLSLENFPRRPASFRLHLLNFEGEVMGSLTIPQPVRGPFEQWRPLPMPQTVSNGVVALTLEEITRHDPGVVESWLELKSRITATDPAWARAWLGRWMIRDATGNEAEVSRQSGIPISPQEPAWKVAVALYRAEESFRPDERWLVSSIAIPSQGQTATLGQSTNLFDRKIVARTVSNARSPLTTGSFYETRGRPVNLPTENPYLLIEVINHAPDDQIRVKVFDQQGRKLNLSDSTHLSTMNDGGSGTGAQFKQHFHMPPGVESLGFEVIVSRPLHVEFTINPAEIQTVTN